MRVLICGDRNWNDTALVEKKLIDLERNDFLVGGGLVIIHGAARGADLIAARAAFKLGIKLEHYPAHWQHHFTHRTRVGCIQMTTNSPCIVQLCVAGQCTRPTTTASGPIRNSQMLKEGKPDRIIAFHDHIDQSKGTTDMLMKAKAARLPWEVISHGQ